MSTVSPYITVRDFLRANGTTDGKRETIAQMSGVSMRSVFYVLPRLREEGLIEERYVGARKRVIIWIGPDADEDEAPSDAHSRVPASA